MKKFVILIIFSFFAFHSFSQIVEYLYGKYYIEDELYTGVFNEYYENGNKKTEINIKNGVLDSFTFMYFENGKMKEQRSFKKGLKDGTWIIWDTNQTKVSEARYKNDLKDGAWYIWYSMG